jgi:YHS domain-containing protein
MNPAPENSALPPLPAIGEPVITACGSVIRYRADTAWTVYRGQRVYFCLPACLSDYERDPLNSCMAFRLLSEKG